MIDKAKFIQVHYKEAELNNLPAHLAVLSPPLGLIYGLDDALRDTWNKSHPYSTHTRSDGSLIYAFSEGQHRLHEKVPDYYFVGMGHWVYGDE